MDKKIVYTISALIAAYVACQLIADIGATRLLSIGGVVVPGGTFVFAITFTLRDMLHKRLGKQWAKSAIWLAAGANLAMAIYLYAISKLPVPPFVQTGETWTGIFALVPAITLASIVAELVSQLLDTEVYHLWRSLLPKAPQWTRVFVSNAISLPVDSFVFATLAFAVLPLIFGGQSISLVQALSATGGLIIWKIVATLVSLPLIYLVKEPKSKLALVEVAE